MSDDPSPLAPAVSPLTEADPHSLDLLIGERINTIMNTRPMDITDADLLVMANYYRTKRAQFIIESQTKAPRAKPGAKRSAPTSVADALASSIDLL